MRSTIIVIAMLCFSLQNNAQFFKFSTGALIPKKGDGAFTLMVSGGARLGNLLHIGASFGYYKFKDSEKPVLPAGVEFSFFDQDKNKLSPYVVLAAYYPFHNDANNYSGSGYTINISTKGVYQLKAGAGIGIPVAKGKMVIISGGYTPAKFETKSKTTTYGAGQPTRTSYDTYSSTSELYFVMFEIAF